MERLPHAILIAAHEWRARMDEEPLTAREQRDFETWLDQDPRHADAFQRAESLWPALARLSAYDLDPALLRPTWTERARSWLGFDHIREGPVTRPALLLRTAAIVTLALLVLLPWKPEEVPQPPLEVSTARGELSEAILSDGTRVTLGAETSLQVAFHETARDVWLQSGEAYFDVEKDRGRPFIVRSGKVRARAVGTAFEVRRRAEGTVVAVSEGLVSVTQSAGTATPRRVELAAGEGVSYSTDAGLGLRTTLDPDTIGAWRDGRLVYIGAPLSDVVADANRYYDRPVVLQDPELRKLELTGSFRSEDIDALLTALTELFPVEIAKSTSQVRLFPRP